MKLYDTVRYTRNFRGREITETGVITYIHQKGYYYNVTFKYPSRWHADKANYITRSFLSKDRTAGENA